jgi:predicted enzyme related to lactoylglutathione lyase
MIFAVEPEVVASWWADLLECPVDRVSFKDGFAWFDVGDIEFGFHPSDATKNTVGGSPVVYLRVEDHSAAIARAQSKGARLHRGPLAIDASRSIAQLVDPYGNVFGLDGPLIQ